MAQLDACDEAYRAGMGDAQAGTSFRVEHFMCEGGSIAYARGWLNGRPSHSKRLAKMMANPKQY